MITATRTAETAITTTDTLEAENKAFMLKLRDATLAAIEETRFAMIVGKLRESTEAKITGHVQDVVELTSKTYGLNQGEQESILDYLVAGGDLSLYGLSNAVTRARPRKQPKQAQVAVVGAGIIILAA